MIPPIPSILPFIAKMYGWVMLNLHLVKQCLIYTGHSGSLSKPNDQIRVLKGRKKKIDYGQEAQLYSMMSGVSNGARGSLTDDLVKYRNAKFSPLNPVQFQDLMNIVLGNLSEHGNNVLDRNGYQSRKKAKKAMVHMKLFIDEASLSIVKYDMRLSEQGIRQVSKQDKGVRLYDHVKGCSCNNRISQV